MSIILNPYAPKITLTNNGQTLTLYTSGVLTFGSAGGVVSVFSRNGAVTPQAGDYNTSLVPENTNLYFTVARVLATVLAGLSTASSAVITTTDTVLSALGKLQAQITASVASIALKANTAGQIFTGNISATNLSGINTGDQDLSALATTSAVNLGLGLKTDKLITENTQTASYTLVLADADRIVTMSNASANNLTIPLNATVAFPIGTQIIISQFGAGQTTIVPTAGVTLNSSLTAQKLTNQFATASLIKLGTDTWLLSGNLSV